MCKHTKKDKHISMERLERSERSERAARAARASKKRKRRRIRKIKKIWNGVTTVLLSIALVFAILIWGLRLIGMNVFIVQSGSMELELHVGALVQLQVLWSPEKLVKNTEKGKSRFTPAKA